ncbi:MAG: EAL domain-containing protein [Actinobacteria bacterium]|nr:EAL domain-containing protein [Actinomycetota bacterium]
MAASGTDPSKLTLEITENVLMDDAESTMGAITARRDLGVGFSIDDFGTGYSSLGYLKRFPVDSVETERELEEPVALGCDTAQGFYFAEPEAAADMHGVRPACSSNSLVAVASLAAPHAAGNPAAGKPRRLFVDGSC